MNLSATRRRIFYCFCFLCFQTHMKTRGFFTSDARRNPNMKHATVVTLWLLRSLWTVKNALASFVRQFPHNEGREMKHGALHTHTHTRWNDGLNYWTILRRGGMYFHSRTVLINCNYIFCFGRYRLKVVSENSVILNLAVNPLSTCARLEMWQNCNLIRHKWRLV